MQRLIFLYNADAGVLNDLRGAVQKAFGGTSDCSLCSITYGVTGEKPRWRAFREALIVPADFYHRDEIPPAIRDFLNATSQSLPVILSEDAEGLRAIVSAEQMTGCGGDEDCLIRLIRSYLKTNR